MRIWLGALLAGLLLASPAVAADPAPRTPAMPVGPYRSCIQVFADDAIVKPPAVPPLQGCVEAEDATPRQRAFGVWTLHGGGEATCSVTLVPDPGKVRGYVVRGRDCGDSAMLRGAVRWSLDDASLTFTDPADQTVLQMAPVGLVGFKGGGMFLVRRIELIPPRKGAGSYELQIENGPRCGVDLNGRNLGGGWSMLPDSQCGSEFGFAPSEERWFEDPPGTVVLGREKQVTFKLIDEGSVTGRMSDGRAVKVTKLSPLNLPLKPADLAGVWSFGLQDKNGRYSECRLTLENPDAVGIKPIRFQRCTLPGVSATGWSLDAAGYLRLHNARGEAILLLWPEVTGFAGQSRKGPVLLRQPLPPR